MEYKQVQKIAKDTIEYAKKNIYADMNKIIEDNKLSDVQVIEIINELSKTDLSINEEDINDDILQWKEEYRRHAFF